MNEAHYNRLRETLGVSIKYVFVPGPASPAAFDMTAAAETVATAVMAARAQVCPTLLHAGF